jgi:lipopolysaccharide biosynthesis protein
VCVLVFESATYCTRCAETLVDQGLASVDDATRQSSAPAQPRSSDSSQRAEWIILVARDQGDLFSHLERAFARDSKVEIILDRRKDYRRNPPGVEERLRIHGAVVVKRPRPEPPKA